MYPVNQVILGGESMFNSMDDLDTLILKMEAYRLRLKLLKESLPQVLKRLIWDDIDAEISPMSDELRRRLLLDSDYVDTYNELLSIVQTELLNLVKSKIENTERGKQLLDKQLKTIKKLKTKIIDDTNREMELFKKFKEYSKLNPGTSYDEFLKNNI